MIKKFSAILLTLGMTITLNAEETDTLRVCDLDELIIVSQPKETYKLRHQPVSSTVLSASDFEFLGLRDLKSMSSYVPSFVMPDYGSRLTSSIYIRGIGSRINNPAVGIYLDGMPLVSKNAFNFHVYEMERADVLRGPQGTLYGQNTEGGLIRLYTKNPMTSQGTSVHLRAASDSDYGVEFGHYARLNDNLAMSLSGFYSDFGGHYENRATGEMADKMKETGGRFRLNYNPSQRVQLDYIADYQYVRQNGFAYGELDKETGKTLDPATTFDGNYRRNMLNTALNATIDLDFAKLYSVTSYQYLKDYMLMDQDYLPEDYMHLIQRQHMNAITEEITLKGRYKKWNYVTGIYAAHKWLKTEAPVFFGDAFCNSIVGKITQNMPEGTKMNLSLDVPGLFHTPEYNLAVFHESNIELLPRLTATLGLRYDYSGVKTEYKTNALAAMDVTVFGFNKKGSVNMILDNETSDHYGRLLPKVGVTYKIDDKGSNVYASVSKGFRAGGFNIQMFSDILQTKVMQNAKLGMGGDVEIEFTPEEYANVNNTIAYKPEESTNYEVGAHFDLLGYKLRADIAAYYMTVRNMQLSVMAGSYGFGRMMVNAGKSYSAGTELSLSGTAFNGHMEWMANYGYTHAVFKKYEPSEGVSYKDNKVPYVPEHTAGGMLSYRFDVKNPILQSIRLSADVNATGKTWWDAANTYSQKFYAIFGARAEADFGKFRTSVWAKNITNTKYNTFAIESSATGTQQCFAQQGRPLQLGVDVKIDF